MRVKLYYFILISTICSNQFIAAQNNLISNYFDAYMEKDYVKANQIYLESNISDFDNNFDQSKLGINKFSKFNQDDDN